jgi:hypothetical protein
MTQRLTHNAPLHNIHCCAYFWLILRLSTPTLRRIVYDPETDTMHGMVGLPLRGKLQLSMRYIVERRARYPSAGMKKYGK